MSTCFSLSKIHKTTSDKTNQVQQGPASGTPNKEEAQPGQASGSYDLGVPGQQQPGENAFWGDSVSGPQGDVPDTTSTHNTLERKDYKSVACLVLALAAVICVGILVPALTAKSSPDCEFPRLNATEINTVLDTVHRDFPQFANATLDNIDDWFPTVNDHFTHPLYRDREGHMIWDVCASIGQHLKPEFLVLGLLVAASFLG